MRFDEIISEAPVAVPTATSAPATNQGIVDKTLSGAAKVSGAIDKTADFARGVQQKIKSLGGPKDPFSAVSKLDIRNILNKVIKQEKLSPQELNMLQKFNNSI